MFRLGFLHLLSFADEVWMLFTLVAKVFVPLGVFCTSRSASKALRSPHDGRCARLLVFLTSFVILRCVLA